MSHPNYNPQWRGPPPPSVAPSVAPLPPSPNTPPIFSPNDIYIAVMGVTGAGKSTFISQCSNEAQGIAGHGLKSTTREISLYTVQHAGRTIRLIDTPGFDDTFRTDADVLRELAYYLSKSLTAGFRLTGIIYLHPITSTRMTGSALKNLRTFRKLCGTGSMGSTILATTMWDDVSLDTGARREMELVSDPTFWGSMVAAGSSVMRHSNSTASALGIIGRLCGRNTTILQLQTEMVEKKMFLNSTAAGREVDSGLQSAHESVTRQLQHAKQDLQEQLQDATGGIERERLIADAIDQQRDLQERLETMERGRMELQTNMERLIKDKEERHAADMRKLQDQFAARQAQMMEQMGKTGQTPISQQPSSSNPYHRQQQQQQQQQQRPQPQHPQRPQQQQQPPPQQLHQQPARSRFSLSDSLSRISLSGLGMTGGPPPQPQYHPQQYNNNPFYQPQPQPQPQPQYSQPYPHQQGYVQAPPQPQAPAQHIHHHYGNNQNTMDPYTAMLMNPYANPYANPYSTYGLPAGNQDWIQQYLKQSQASTQATTQAMNAYTGMQTLSTAAAVGSCSVM